MATIQKLIATVLIQIGADEPKAIGTIEIPIEISTGEKKTTPTFRGAATDDGLHSAAYVSPRVVQPAGTQPAPPRL